MGRKSNICQAIWEAEWEVTGNGIPADVRALTLGATSVNRWFELLCESEYTTASECARLHAGMSAAEGIGRHHNKHREIPNEQMSVVKQVLRDVARSMSARFPKSKDEATKPDRKHKSIQVPAKPVLSDTHGAEDETPQKSAYQLRLEKLKSIVAPEHLSTLAKKVNRQLVDPSSPPSDLSQKKTHKGGDEHTGLQPIAANTTPQESSAPQAKHDTSSESVECSRTHQSTEPSKNTELNKATTSPHALTDQQCDAAWDLVTEDHEKDDVVSIAATDEGEEEFEHVEASTGEEDYHDVRLPSGRGKIQALRNFVLYGPD